MTWREFAERAISVPFAERGRGYEGWDCWGLVVCAYRDVLGVELPRYDNYQSIRDHRRIRRLVVAGVKEWDRAGAQDGAVAVIYRRSFEIHTGLVIEGGRRILHCEENVHTVHEPIGHFRIEGLYVQRSNAA